MALPAATTKVLLYTRPISMAWGLDRMSRLCREETGSAPQVGTAFLFFNRAHDRLRIYFRSESEDDFVEKLLKKGRFLLPTAAPGCKFVQIDRSKLGTLFRS